MYDIGVGIADITGPVVDIQLWGYATFNQAGNGIHTRLFSRAFIIGDGERRVVLVTTDIGSMSQLLKVEVIRRLHEKYGDMYSLSNVCLTATHTHSGPGGYHQYELYSIASLGFSKQNFEAIVSGIVQSIEDAHNTTKKGYLYWNTGTLLNANYNRSPKAYNRNPIEERQRYVYDVEKLMRIIKMTDLEGNPMGMINWFPVHPTSINNTNLLVGSDNKGYAEIKFEEFMNKQMMLGKGPLVSAFPQESHGDTSPNILGPRCMDTGEECDLHYLNCGGNIKQCVAIGPGKDMYESAAIIGERLKKKAVEIFETAQEKIHGKVDFIHQYYDIVNVTIDSRQEKPTTCKPALGTNMGRGTTDGAGMILPPTTSSEEQKSCHFPKQILFNSGEGPAGQQPTILPTQILKIGNVVVLPVPAEFTTMSGRRLKANVEKAFQEINEESSNAYFVVQSLSNGYSSYVTTYEEYQENIYEGASTTYGPHTLEAYIQQYSFLMKKLMMGEQIEEGPQPPNDLDQQRDTTSKIPKDNPPEGKQFGDVLEQPQSNYTMGETVSSTFVSGNPRNDLKTGSTYLTVEQRKNSTGIWEIIATDANWETKLNWKSTNKTNGESQVTITWEIPANVKTGNYRIRHFGNWRGEDESVNSYEGESNVFTVE